MSWPDVVSFSVALLVPAILIGLAIREARAERDQD
jgi:hypothetical protein